MMPNALEIPEDVCRKVLSALIAAHVYIDNLNNHALTDQIGAALDMFDDALQDAEATEE